MKTKDPCDIGHVVANVDDERSNGEMITCWIVCCGCVGHGICGEGKEKGGETLALGIFRLPTE